MQGIDAKPSLPDFTELCDKYGGNVSAIAGQLGVARNTVVRWVAGNKSFKQAIDDAREASLDLAEDRMMMLINGIPIKNDDDEIVAWQERPDPGLIKFKLATHGKNRGYGESLDVTSKGESLNKGFYDFLKQTSTDDKAS